MGGVIVNVRASLKSVRRDQRLVTASGYVLVLFGCAVSLTTPLITKEVVDVLIPLRDLASLLFFGAVYLGLFAVGQLVSVLQSSLFFAIGNDITRRIREKIFRDSTAAGTLGVSSAGQGDALSRLTDDLSTVASFSSTNMVDLVSQMITLALSLVLVFSIDIRMACVVVVAAPLLLAANALYLVRYKKSYAHLREKLGALTEQMGDLWQHRGVLHQFWRSRYSERTMNIAQEAVFKGSARLFRLQLVMDQVQGLITFLPPFLVLFLGAVLVMNGELTVGAIVAMMSYMGRIYSPIRSVTSFRTRYQSFQVALDRLQDLVLNKDSEVPAEQEAGLAFCETDSSCPSVTFNQVSFAYKANDGASGYLRDVQLELLGPGVVRIEGPNGCGKTTLLRLMSGALVPSSGTINICGISRDHADRLEKPLIAFSDQNDAVFHDTVENNCTLGDPLRVSELSRLRDSGLGFLVPPELDLDSVISGNSLSGGQRKRICLLRALLPRTPVVVLDEPFGPLDDSTTRQLCDWISKQAPTQLFIIVDHNDSPFELLGASSFRTTRLSASNVGHGLPDEVLQNV